jgi:redox-sensitive bicupin YhaK (pirin superfamily)
VDDGRVHRDDARIDVISGATTGVSGLAQNRWPISGAVVTIDPATDVEFPLPADDRAFCYVLSGSVTIAGRRVGPARSRGPIRWTPDRALVRRPFDCAPMTLTNRRS